MLLAVRTALEANRKEVLWSEHVARGSRSLDREIDSAEKHNMEVRSGQPGWLRPRRDQDPVPRNGCGRRGPVGESRSAPAGSQSDFHEGRIVQDGSPSDSYHAKCARERESHG